MKGTPVYLAIAIVVIAFFSLLMQPGEVLLVLGQRLAVIAAIIVGVGYALYTTQAAHTLAEHEQLTSPPTTPPVATATSGEPLHLGRKVMLARH